jgi:predicted aconitase
MVQLTAVDRAFLAGERGMGEQFAMQTLIAVAEMQGARKFIDIEWAHVAAAYLQGQANIDFANKLLEWNTTVSVPTTLTACSYDPYKPGATDTKALALTEVYRSMGCEPVLTCAPYQARQEPAFGEHVAWCESSAVVYANSVLGARTNCYPEFIDMCAAIVGRVPECGLHLEENRKAGIVFELLDLPREWFRDDWLLQSLGILVGQRSGNALPAIIGLPQDTSRDQLRALGSAAASSGSVSMFHAVGVTPEAPTLEAASKLGRSVQRIQVTAADIEHAAVDLSSSKGQPVSAVCVGAPHFSVDEFSTLAALLGGRHVAPGLKLIASTSAAVLGELEKSGIFSALREAGVEFTVGRCTYYRPPVADLGSHVMTNSAKWAWYAQSSLDVDVTFASLAECVEQVCSND